MAVGQHVQNAVPTVCEHVEFRAHFFGARAVLSFDSVQPIQHESPDAIGTQRQKCCANYENHENRCNGKPMRTQNKQQRCASQGQMPRLGLKPASAANRTPEFMQNAGPLFHMRVLGKFWKVCRAATR